MPLKTVSAADELAGLPSVIQLWAGNRKAQKNRLPSKFDIV
jgi:hypothetical protein